MSLRFLRLTPLPALLASVAAAQAMPTTQPNMVEIFREMEKPGHAGPHEATEARWAELNRAAGFPYSYLALVAVSGSPEVWWVQGMDSFDTFGKANAFGEDKPAYRQNIARVAMEDADHITGVNRMQARAIPEAGHGAFPDIAKMRVFSVLTVRIRPGHETAFTEIAKHYAAAAGGAGVVGWRTYQVLTGAPGGTYLVFSTFPSWAAVDANEAAWGKAMAGAAPHLEAALKLVTAAVMSTEQRYFSINPQMSLVPKELAASDPFWAPKPTGR